jgi:ParB family chromosome partitioning protein
MKSNTIQPMAKRKYATIPLDKIKVLNSRNRDPAAFKHNVRSIEEVGLLVPIVVNERYYKRTGYYDLVCGEGRFLAYKKLEQEEILAEVISCDRKQALLRSLVENIARVPPRTMWFAREVKRMHDSGCSYEQISKITGYSVVYIQEYIRLVEQGEERLIKGVEDGVFPISFAVQVARSDNSSIQNLMMDAFDSGIVNSTNLTTVRNIITTRLSRGTRTPKPSSSKTPYTPPEYTINQLKADITKITKDKEAFVKEATVKENRLFALLEGLKMIWQDSDLVTLIQAEGVGVIPQLTGEYHVR